MKFAIFAAVLSASIAGTAFAERPGTGWISRPALSRVIAGQGYRITSVEADDGHWEGEMTKASRDYEFHADAHTGHLTKIEAKPAHRD
jgi:hypothetical protein